MNDERVRFTTEAVKRVIEICHCIDAYLFGQMLRHFLGDSNPYNPIISAHNLGKTSRWWKHAFDAEDSEKSNATRLLAEETTTMAELRLQTSVASVDLGKLRL